MARPAVPDEQPEYGTKPANLPGSISTGQHIELSMERPEPTIGRDPDNAIRLDDPKGVTLARRTAADRLGMAHSRHRLPNGTYINGSQITATITLHDGDVTDLGNASFTFHQRGGTRNTESGPSGGGYSQRRSLRRSGASS
jgi:predicted component of type VI protein secretion system